MSNLFVMSLLSYKERYASLSSWQFLLLKILQPTVQVLFFVLIITANHQTSQLSNTIIANSLLSACIYSSIYSAFTLNNERILGTLKFTVVSDRSAFQTIYIRSLSSIPDGVLTVFVPILLAFLVFHVNFSLKQLGITFLCFFLGIFASVALSLLIGCVSLVSTDLNLFVNILIFLLNFTSGAIFPVKLLPFGLAKLVKFIPLNNTIALTQRLLDGYSLFSAASADFIIREILLSLIVILMIKLSYRHFEKKAIIDGSLDFY